MNKITLLALLVFVGCSAVHAQNVNIPDANFKAALVANSAINTNSDTAIQVSEASAFTGTIDVASLLIADLKGIEAFTALTNLYCEGNQLDTLDLSSNTALNLLHCYNNPLRSLNVTNAPLTYLFCYNSQLTALDISTNINLIELRCNNNQLTSLNVSTNTALTVLNCGGNQISTLNVTSNTQLTGLIFYSNPITSIDLSNNTALTALSLSGSQLSTLDLSANLSLTTLDCSYNQLSSLDLSANSALYYLWCYNNQLTSLNVKNGNNANMTDYTFRAQNNPNLSCIEVDDVIYSTTTWISHIDSISDFNEDCSVTNIVKQENLTDKLQLFPNPSSSQLNIQSDLIFHQAQIFSINGALLKNIIQPGKTLDVSDLPQGMYIIKLRTEEEDVQTKFVKE